MYQFPACAPAQPRYRWPMKFLLAVAVYLGMGVFIGWGIYAMMHGKPAILIVSLLAYLVIAAKKGCLDSH